MTLRTYAEYSLTLLFIILGVMIVGTILVVPVLGIFAAAVALGSVVAVRRRLSGIVIPNWIGR